MSGGLALGLALVAVGVCFGAAPFVARQREFVDRAEGVLAGADPRHPSQHVASCPASHLSVRETEVSSSWVLYGLCPGCGIANPGCTPVRGENPYGPWRINSHAPFVHPDYGLHSGRCWTEKKTSGDMSLCVCHGHREAA